jgi:hypothetical protein
MDREMMTRDQQAAFDLKELVENVKRIADTLERLLKISEMRP